MNQLPYLLPWVRVLTELLEKLSTVADDAAKRAKGWPGTARTLGSALRRITPSLWAVGVNVTIGDREAGTGRRLIFVEARRNGGDSSVTTVTTVTRDRCDDSDGSHRTLSGRESTVTELRL